MMMTPTPRGERRSASTLSSQDRAVQMPAQLGVDVFGARVVDLGELVEVLVERGAHAAVALVVAPLAGLTSVPSRTSSLRNSMNCWMRLSNSANCAASALRTCLRQSATTAAMRSLNLQQQRAVALGGRNVRRHVDAAQFHHHRVDQAVDALDVLRADEATSRTRRSAACCAATLTSRDAGQRHGRGREQREDRIELGRDREAGQLRHGPGPRYASSGPSNCPQSVNLRLSILAVRAHKFQAGARCR